MSRFSQTLSGFVPDIRPPEEVDAASIREDLLTNGARYDFFYAVGMMERLYPEAIRVGGGGPCTAEAIRFRHSDHLSFSAGDIFSIRHVDRPRRVEERLEEGLTQRFEVTTRFLGLTGTVSPLPLAIAEEITQDCDHDPIQRDFLDLFHHRWISFVYRIGVKYDLAREYAKKASDPWSRRILALAGFDVWGAHSVEHIAMWQLLRLAPLLSGRSRGVRMIEVALEDLLAEALDGAQVTVHQFMGEWSPLGPEQRMSLGARNHALGVGSLLGKQCYDKACRAVVEIGVLGHNFRRFLTDGDMYPRLVEALSLLSREPIQYQLRMKIRDLERPPFHLGGPRGCRIGVDSWLSSREDLAGATTLDVDLPASVP